MRWRAGFGGAKIACRVGLQVCADHQASSFGCEGERDSASEAGGGAGNDCYFVQKTRGAGGGGMGVLLGGRHNARVYGRHLSFGGAEK